MKKEWQDLTRMTQGKSVTVERVRLEDSGIAIEGEFSLPPLAGLSAEDQVFVIAFIRCHGSIKEMEGMFGISYPTVKGRLNRITEKLEFTQVIPASPRDETIAALERGEISAEEAIRRLEK